MKNYVKLCNVLDINCPRSEQQQRDWLQKVAATGYIYQTIKCDDSGYFVKQLDDSEFDVEQVNTCTVIGPLGKSTIVRTHWETVRELKTGDLYAVLDLSDSDMYEVAVCEGLI